MPLDYPLCIVRHGETDWNAEGRLQGQQDVQMNGRGRDQAEAVGRLLVQRAPEVLGWDFVASPLIRTRDTMELMRAAMGVDPEDLPPRSAPQGADLRLLGMLDLGRCEAEWFPDRARQAQGRQMGLLPAGRRELFHALGSHRRLASRREGADHRRHPRRCRPRSAGPADRDGAGRSAASKDIKQGRALMFEGDRARWI